DLGFTLVDLGEQKLKDLDRPVRLYQLAAPGLDPPPALDAPAGLAAGLWLQRAVPQHDLSPELPGQAAAAAASALPRGRRWPRLVGANRGKRLLAVAGAVALAAALLVAVAARGGPHLVAPANTVGVIDTGQASLSVVVTGVGRPNGIASGAGAVWVTDS